MLVSLTPWFSRVINLSWFFTALLMNPLIVSLGFFLSKEIGVGIFFSSYIRSAVRHLPARFSEVHRFFAECRTESVISSR